MDITRIGTTQRWSDIVIHNRTVYAVEVAASVDADLDTQAREVLEQLADSLEKADSDKTRLLMVTVWLNDIGEIDTFNRHWDAWVPAGCAPVRACVQAALAKPGYLVEIQAMAAQR